MQRLKHRWQAIIGPQNAIRSSEIYHLTNMVEIERMAVKFRVDYYMHPWMWQHCHPFKFRPWISSLQIHVCGNMLATLIYWKRTAEI